MKVNEVVGRLTTLAERQHGIITRHQALELGATDKTMAALVAGGVFRRDHAGVYVAVGTPPSPLTSVRAALAAVGPDSVASHSTAAWLAGLLARAPRTIDVLTTDRHPHRLAGVRFHRASVPPQIRMFQAVPCTAIPRTLVDLAVILPPTELDLAVDSALSRRLVQVSHLEAEMAAGARRGTARLRSCLEERGDICVPDASVLEAQVARLFTRFGLPVPRPEVHAGPAGSYRIDYSYPDRWLAMEFNGYTWHHSPKQMASDLARQRKLTLGGWLVLAYSWKDVMYDGDRVTGEIAMAYRQRAPMAVALRGVTAGGRLPARSASGSASSGRPTPAKANRPAGSPRSPRARGRAG